MKGAVSAFSQYEAQVASVNHQLERMIALHKVTDAKGFANLQSAAATASKTFRDAAASTGQFEVRQLRLNSATDDYIKKLNSQKLSFRQMAKQRQIANAAYKQQLALENMSIQKGPASSAHNKGMYDVIIPKQASAELDTARKRLGFFNAELKSGATQMLNWGKNTQWAGRQLMVGFTMPILAFGAAVGVMAYQVDKELTRITKVYDTTAASGIAREKELKQVREDSLKTAMTAAREYGYASKDTLAVQAELAATGKTGLDLQRGTLEVQRISRLGEVEQQTAIDATIALQTQWKLSNEELSESFNYMNSIENATSLATADFAAAIPIAGSAVKMFGGDVQELGILLTAMKENGIGATEGANAIKATLQRLGRPSKQIRMEWQALTGTDITKLVDDSDNLTEIFTKINAATRDIGDDKRRKAFAGLFGSYQIARMTAMTQGMQDLEDGVGQVSTAYQIAQQDSSTWAETAKQEMEQYTKSISGQWETAFNTMKAELAEMGEPFVVLATQVVKGVTSIAKAFDRLPDFAKMMIAGSIGVAALAGGLLMLAGLMGNLIANGLKGVAMINSLAGKMNLVDTETKAASLSADLAAKAFLDEASAASTLTNQINLLTASLKEADLAQRQQITGARIVGPPTASQKKTALNDSRNDTYNYAKAQLASPTKNGIRYRNPRFETTNPMGNTQAPLIDSRGRTKTFMNEKETHVQTLNVLHEEALAMDRAQNHVAQENNAILNTENELREKKNNRIRAGAGLLAIESVAMVGLMGINNETTDQIFQMVMLAGMVAPAFAAVGPHVARAGAGIKDAAKSAAVAAKGAVTLGGGMKGALGGAKGMAMAIGGMMGPVGWIATGLAVAGTAMFVAYERHKKARAEAIKDQKTLNDLAKSYASETGKAWTDFQKMNRAKYAVATSQAEQNVYDESRGYYKDADSGKAAVKAYKKADSADQSQEELQLFIDSQVHMEMSAKEAAANVKAFMVSAGDSYAEATLRANELLSTLGKIDSADDYAAIMDAQRGDLKNNAYDIDKNRFMAPDVAFDPKEAKRYAEQEAATIVGTFEQALKTAVDSGDMDAIKEVFDNFTKTASSGWSEFWGENIEENEKALTVMKRNGIEDINDLTKWWNSHNDLERMSLTTDLDLAGVGEAGELERSLNSANAIDQALTKAYAEANGLGKEVKNVIDLLNADPVLMANILNFDEQRDAVIRINEEIEKMKANGAKPEDIASTTQKGLDSINAMSVSQGFETSSNYSRALWYWTNKVKVKTDEAADSAAALAKNLSSADILNSNYNPIKYLGLDKAKEALRDSMEGIQEEIADSERGALDDRIERERDAAQAGWDAQRDALDRRQEAEEKALDRAWEGKRTRLEAYWDSRIKGIEKTIELEQKAEEARKKMFEAEVSRIQRLADMANTNIDFNVALNEGNLDEAARIQNNANAEDAKFVFDREAEAGTEKSEKRIEKLEGKKTKEEEAKDRALKAFDEREERAKTHFQRMKKMEQASLDARAKADMKAKEAGWKREKENLDKILETFLAFAPTNRKQLEKHMANLGISMVGFENRELRPMSKRWGNYIKDELKRGIDKAALAQMSDNLWAEMGAKGVRELVKSLGFTGERQYNKFIKTGKLFGRGKGNPDGSTGVPINHDGGLIANNGGSGRRGVAKNFHGLHPSETMVLAQKGEFMVNRKDAKKNQGVLEHINNGGDVMGGAGAGPGAFISALTAGLFMKGFKQNITEKVQKKRAARAASQYGYTSAPTAYSLPGVKPWALEAANYLGSKFGISTIGGVGDRSNNPYSDHPRGLALDFMTGDVAKGNALAAEALKLGPKLDATYMIWQKRIHSFDSRGWRPYSHPSGASNPTLDHMDHVHMSFSPNGKAGDLPTTQNGGKLVQGRGGKFHPTGRVGSTGSRIHGSPPAIDISLPVGNKVYAARDGVVSSSYDIRGHEPRAPHGGLGYRSYGRVITLNHDGGGSSLYAHLSQRIAQAGQRVKAGTAIGLSGNTGYSTGPHLHFGGSPSPTAFLRKGAEYVKYDNTAATLHRGESVLTKNLTQKMHEGVDRFANGGGEQYNIEVNIIGFDGDTKALAREVANQIKRETGRAPQKRSVGGKP